MARCHGQRDVLESDRLHRHLGGDDGFGSCRRDSQLHRDGCDPGQEPPDDEERWLSWPDPGILHRQRLLQLVTSAADPIFQIAVFENIGGPGEPRPGVGLFIVPHFSVTRFFALFDASSDERVQFHDRSSIPSNISVSRLWNFGDNAFSQEKDPMHHYNFSFSATFDVTLAVCQNDVCNITTQPVAMMRWHVLLIGAILIGTTVIALVEIRRLGRKK